jgi:hypothetical protein
MIKYSVLEHLNPEIANAMIFENQWIVSNDKLYVNNYVYEITIHDIINWLETVDIFMDISTYKTNIDITRIAILKDGIGNREASVFRGHFIKSNRDNALWHFIIDAFKHMEIRNK